MTGTYVSAPPANPRPVGLLSVADVTDNGDEHVFFGGSVHEPEVCGLAHPISGACFDTSITVSYLVGETEDTISFVLQDEDENIVYTISVDGEEPLPFTAGQFDMSIPNTDEPASHDIVIAANGLPIFEGELTYPQAEDSLTYAQQIKQFDGYGVTSGKPFTLYKGVECYLNGGSNAERATRALELSEGNGIEQHFWTMVLAAGAEDVTPTPGTAVDMKIGLGLLEERAAATYAALPTMHMGLAVATVAYREGFIDKSGNSVTTISGAPVVVGSGYLGKSGPNGVVAGDNEAWVYISGPVAVRRGPVVVTEAPNYRQNLTRAIAERQYIATYDCVAYAVLVTI